MHVQFKKWWLAASLLKLAANFSGSPSSDKWLQVAALQLTKHQTDLGSFPADTGYVSKNPTLYKNTHWTKLIFQSDHL